jgi:hypothetical protein
MHATPLAFLATIGIPSEQQCLRVAAPILALAAFWWLLNRVDQIVDHLFPHWEWERKLGWLNIRAQRQADALLRWIWYGIYALLAVALYGIVWSVQALQEIDNWDDPHVLAELAFRVPVLLVSLGLWLVYLGSGLIPKLRHEHETHELEKFREGQEEVESDFGPNHPHREKTLPNPDISPTG